MALATVALTFATSAVAAPGEEFSVSLAPAGAALEAKLPAGYGAATLTIDNRSGRAVAAAELRLEQGGPRFVVPATVAPQSKASVNLPLPAASASQAYVVRLFETHPPTGEPLAALTAELRWPVDVVDGEARVNSVAYADWRDAHARWPADLRRTVLLTAVLVCLALAGCLLIRRPMARLAAGCSRSWRRYQDAAAAMAS